MKTDKLYAQDLAIPTLPARNLLEILMFYEQLGFQNCSASAYEDYLILRRHSLEIHFFHFSELDPAESYSGCYLRVMNVAELFEEFSQKSLPSAGIPRLGELQDQPWGMREFYLVDPSGNLLRIGQVIA
ncbi:VOC family protein [Phormidium tenue FACHB-886]|nr:VOC family protein [Phormidium tenue FACHB-886]